MLAVASLSVVACQLSHEVDVKPTQHTVTIEPIYMKVDVNLKVQRELDEFYDDVTGEAPDSKEGEEP